MKTNMEESLKPGTIFIKNGERMYVHNAERNLDTGGWDIEYEPIATYQKHYGRALMVFYLVIGLVVIGIIGFTIGMK